MATRLVPKENARTAEEAEFFVKNDSGGAVIPTGRTREVLGGFAVECFSTDGFSGPPDGTSGRTCFTVVAVRGEAVDFSDRMNYKFTVSRSSLGLGSVTFGMVISGRIKAGSQFQIDDAYIENEPAKFSERKEFDGAGESAASGWAPYSNPKPPSGRDK